MCDRFPSLCLDESFLGIIATNPYLYLDSFPVMKTFFLLFLLTLPQLHARLVEYDLTIAEQ